MQRVTGLNEARGLWRKAKPRARQRARPHLNPKLAKPRLRANLLRPLPLQWGRTRLRVIRSLPVLRVHPTPILALAPDPAAKTTSPRIPEAKKALCILGGLCRFLESSSTSLQDDRFCLGSLPFAEVQLGLVTSVKASGAALELC